MTIPLLDCHAHVAPDVTPEQLRGLDGAHVFAVTRSIDEARTAAARPADDAITWGLGVHPGLASARRLFDRDAFAGLLDQFALVGEVGLDASSGDRPQQRAIFESVLSVCTDAPVLISVHSYRATAEMTELVTAHPHPGTILHWWLGDQDETRTVAAAGAYFSVNAAMTDERLASLPSDRVLPETDFVRPGRRGRKPGDTMALVRRLAKLWETSPDGAAHMCWANLRRAAVSSGALDRLPAATADALLDV